MSYLALDILQSLEQSGSRALMVLRNADRMVELWVDSGKITKVDGIALHQLKGLLIEEAIEIFIKPVTQEVFEEQSISIKDLALETALACDMSQVNSPVTIPEVTAAIPPQPDPVQSKKRLTSSILTAPPQNQAPNGTALSPVSSSTGDRRKKTSSHMLLSFKKGEKITHTIGRSEDNTIILPTSLVSRKHCEVVFDGEELVVKDLQSTHGTYLNGNRIFKAVSGSHDVLQVGEHLFIMVVESGR